MNTYQLTPQQEKITIGALKFRASRKLQQVRNMERRKETLIGQIGEEEFSHRIVLREKYANKLKLLVSDLSAFVDAEDVSQNGL